MADQGKLTEAVFGAIAELNEALPADRRVAARLDAVLAGESAALSSVELVTLFAAAEDRVEQRFGVQVSLFDEAEAEPTELTVGDLVERLARLLDGGADD